MPEDDKKFEAALAGFFHRESHDNAARLLCPDPELLAAYHEHALSPEETQAMRQHVAGCVRCQEVLAHLADSENLPLETEQRDRADATLDSARVFHGQNVRVISRSHGPWRWIAPAGAIAASLLVWIAYRELRPAQQSVAPAVQIAENRKEMEMAATPSAPSSTVATAVPQKKEEDSTAADNLARKIDRFNSTSRQVPQKPELPLATGKVLNKMKQPSSSNVIDNLQPDTRSPSAMPRTENVEVQAYAVEEPKLAEKPAPSPLNLPAENSDMTISGAAPAPAPPAKVQEKRATPYGDENTETGRLKARVATAALLQNNPTLILAPDASVMWRVGAAGSIEFSSEGGGEWQRQASGVTAELVSGFAPQKNVCWVVGRSGTILLTIDSGATWRKIASPTSNDLGGVHATDALHATVWEATGQRKFETADGGRTWNQVAGQ